MITLEKEFETNANSTGLQTFRQVKVGVRKVVNRRTKEARDQNVYVYQRITKDGSTFGFEVVVPHVLKSGTVQKFPNGTTREIADDTEMYPGASQFGTLGWFCANQDRAEELFDELIQESVSDSESNEEEAIRIPNHEFAVKDYAEELGLSYIEVSNWAQAMIREGKIRVIRTERRAARGRATNILSGV